MYSIYIYTLLTILISMVNSHHQPSLTIGFHWFLPVTRSHFVGTAQGATGSTGSLGHRALEICMGRCFLEKNSDHGTLMGWAAMDGHGMVMGWSSTTRRSSARAHQCVTSKTHQERPTRAPNLSPLRNDGN